MSHVLPKIAALVISSRVWSLLFPLIILSCLSSTVFGQAVVRVTGRVVDEAGEPIEGADVYLAPIYDPSWKLDDLIVESVVTGNDGRFTIAKTASPKQQLYLYVSRGGGLCREMVTPPFYLINNFDKRLIGRRLIFGDAGSIDVGDVNVQFWYATVEIGIRSKGRALTENQWRSLWVRVRNDQGRVLEGESVGPVIQGDEIDLKTSTFRICLPEGRWSVDFQSFDQRTGKPGRRIIGRSGTIVIRRDKTAEAKISLNGDFPI